MKKLIARYRLLLGALAVVAAATVLVPFGALAQSTVKNYFSQCGASSTGCDNILNITGTWKIGTTAVTPTAAQLNAVTIGVAGGYKVARGAATLDGSNPTTAATGLTTVVACTVTGPAAAQIPADDPMGAVGVISTTNLNIYAWKTDGTDPTPVASTNSAAVFYWICVGT